MTANGRNGARNGRGNGGNGNGYRAVDNRHRRRRRNRRRRDKVQSRRFVLVTIIALVVAIKLPDFVFCGFYTRWWRYVSTRDM